MLTHVRKGPSKLLMFRIAGVLFAFCALAGCGQRVGDVSGSVQFKGKPITSGTVTMVGKDGVPHQTSIGEDGNYKLRGIPIGEVTVAVSSPPLEASKTPRREERKDPKTGQPIQEKSTELIATESQKKSWRAIPIEYSDITQAKIKTTLVSGPNAYEIKLD